MPSTARRLTPRHRRLTTGPPATRPPGRAARVPELHQHRRGQQQQGHHGPARQRRPAATPAEPDGVCGPPTPAAPAPCGLRQRLRPRPWPERQRPARPLQVQQRSPADTRHRRISGAPAKTKAPTASAALATRQGSSWAYRSAARAASLAWSAACCAARTVASRTVWIPSSRRWRSCLISGMPSRSRLASRPRRSPTSFRVHPWDVETVSDTEDMNKPFIAGNNGKTPYMAGTRADAIILAQHVGHMRTNRQGAGQTRRFDAKQIHQSGHAMLARPWIRKSAAGSCGPWIFGRMPA